MLYLDLERLVGTILLNAVKRASHTYMLENVFQHTLNCAAMVSCWLDPITCMMMIITVLTINRFTSVVI